MRGSAAVRFCVGGNGDRRLGNTYPRPKESLLLCFFAPERASDECLSNEKDHHPAVREEADIVCDVTGKPAVAGLVAYFWYGDPSRNDSFKAGQKSLQRHSDWTALLEIWKQARQSALNQTYTVTHSTPGTASPLHSVAPVPTNSVPLTDLVPGAQCFRPSPKGRFRKHRVPRINVWLPIQPSRGNFPSAACLAFPIVRRSPNTAGHTPAPITHQPMHHQRLKSHIQTRHQIKKPQTE